jgi:CTP synthase (UTP-ammonia lyase)
MNQSLRVGIIGDFNPRFHTHTATNEALGHAANAWAVTVEYSWLPTETLQDESSVTKLKQFDALWCSAGSPYVSMNGALTAIRFARENDWPFIGT